MFSRIESSREKCWTSTEPSRGGKGVQLRPTLKITRRLPDGKTLLVRQGAQRPPESSDGQVAYGIRVPAPTTPGAFDVVIQVRDALVGLGQISVKPRPAR